jgi:hypothetical protein
MEIALVLIAMSVFIGYTAFQDDGFKFIVYDVDRDGIVQEGTKYERKFLYWDRDPLKKYRERNK